MKRYIGLLLVFVLIISSMHVSAVEQLTDFTNIDFQSDTVDSKPRTGTSSSVKNSRMRLISTGVITKQEIKERCPDISETTIQRTLGELVKSNKIKKIRS